jgi:TRAP-type mannitol/chloroaromatic compound transport system permease large subunit
MPGFLLSGLYLVYIVLVAIFKKGAAPKLPPDFGPQPAALSGTRCGAACSP